MSFLFKILFAAIIFALVGGMTFLSIKDVNVHQETVTKEISVENAKS